MFVKYVKLPGKSQETATSKNIMIAGETLKNNRTDL